MAKIRGNNFVARCYVCDEALSSFEPQHEFSSTFTSWFEAKNGSRELGKSLHFALVKCSGCGLGAFTKYITDTDGNIHIRDFHPEAPIRLILPEGVPEGIVEEFRSAEACAGIREFRPAGAMLRSTLDKVLLDHGYIERQLSTNITNAANDGVITLPLKKRATEIVKALGDEILHQAWKKITPEQYEDSHEYAQRIIENFYDDPESVREILIEKGRIIPKEEVKEK